MWYRLAWMGQALAVLALCTGITVAGAQPGKGDDGAADMKVETFKDWEVRCPKNSSSKKGCEMTQLVKGDSGQPILRVVVGYPPNIDTGAMILILPLGTRLAPGLELSVDGDDARRIPFQICLKQGCRADYPLDDALRRKLRGGHAAQVSLIDPNGKQMDLKLSLQGYTDADNRIHP